MPRFLFFHCDAVGDLSVFLAGDDAAIEQLVFTGVGSSGNDAIGGLVRDARQACELALGCLVQIEWMVCAGARQALLDALRYCLGVVLQFSSGFGCLLSDLVRT